ncbi:hypothetical protein SC499_26230 [Peribacillus simplex]|uniref:DUF6060 domain-containing protein n=1 Tax=Peribacillus simplex TaxID=1478 RepID=UPI00298E8BAB|nr:hypothetical protein [Peribacillus simplex]MDW7618053.1 hypothetical protein [Peribacillus simplex]
MMKFIKGLVVSTTFALGLSLCFTSPYAAGKAEVKQAERFYDPEFKAEISAYENTENGLVPLTQEEYKALNEEKEEMESPEGTSANLFNRSSNPSVKSSTDGIVTPMDNYYEYWRYYESSVTTYTGNPIQVTSTIYCNTSGGCSISKSVSSTVSSSYSANVSTSAEKSAIQSGVSYTWVSSASDTSTYTFNLAKGNKGYIAFKPTKRKSSGTLKKYSNWDGFLYSKSAYCRNPVKLSNGEAKGVYTFIYQ